MEKQIIMKAIDQAKKIYAEHEDMEIMSELVSGVNQIVKIYQDLNQEKHDKINAKDLSDVDGMDFNEYYHDQLDDIESVYTDLKSKLGQLQYEQDGFSVIN